MVWRTIAVIVAGLFLGLLVVRNAFVDAYLESSVDRAASVWPGHPEVVLASGLTEVGAAAASGQPVNPATVRRMLAAASNAPLAPEPFLVRGVEAQVAGDTTMALRAFIEARRRDPRSIAARYFLASHFLAAGQTPEGLAEISALTRLVPQSLKSVSPQLAAFARMPGGATQVRTLLRDQPQLEPWLLEDLASRPVDAGLVLSLWSGRTPEPDRAWQARLVNSLVTAGRFGEAHSAWRRFQPGTAQSGELVDPKFEGHALPPFGWTLASGASGVAEPEAGGRLHILYYGRDDFVLASQLLLLKPGSYRLSMRVGSASPAAKSLSWTIRCLPSSRELEAIDLGSAKAGVLAAAFAVPPGCEAQNLELAGTAPELPEQADVTISALKLARIGQ
jgi:hypothetical protein